MPKGNVTGLPVEKVMSDACVARLVENKHAVIEFRKLNYFNTENCNHFI